MSRRLEWRISLIATLLAASMAMSYRGCHNIFFLAVSGLLTGYLARRTLILYQNRPKKIGCRDEDIGLMGPFPVRCPCGCEKGLLRSDGRNTQGTLTFLMCDACSCTYEADDLKPKTKADDSIFRRSDGSWGWYDETWNPGDDIKYATREAAAEAQLLYARHVLGT